MSDDLARRRALLAAAVGFALLDTRGKPAPSEVQTVRRWLNNWTGLGHVAQGMRRQGYRLDLTDVDGSVWRATFSSAPLLSSDGFATDQTPWRAAQVAAWNALNKTAGDAREPAPVEDVILP